MSLPTYYNYSPVFPNPFVCLKELVGYGATELHARLPWNGLGVWLEETWHSMSVCVHMDWYIILLPLLFFAGITGARFVLNKVLIRKIPIWCKLDKEGTAKFPDSVWKMLLYTVTFVWATYLVFFGEDQLFFDLKSHFSKWYLGGAPVASAGVYWLYMFELGWYYHQAYAAIYMDAFRKDTTLIMVHHFITIALLFFSFIIRFHNIGLFILFLQDIGDVTIELSKTVVYFKTRGGGHCRKTEIVANICFALFTLQHIVFRLYWFPTKAIYSTMVVGMITHPGGPFYLPFNTGLWILYGMQVYWFKFIIHLLFKLVILRQEIQDARELDEDEEFDCDESKEEDVVPAP
eukprot:Em0010g871a